LSVDTLRNITTPGTICVVIAPNDIVVLVRLMADPSEWTFRSLGAELEMDPAALHRSVARLREAKLLGADRQPNRGNAEEFLIHALRYAIPAELGPLGRGVPTAWGAAPLADLLAESGEPAPVWPDPEGASRGPQVEPIANAVPRLAGERPELGEWFALLDAIRIGRARERKLAADQLRKRIWVEAAVPA
jgi:hypothetical protein